MALATSGIEEPIAVLARERGDGYVLEAEGPDVVAYLSREIQKVNGGHSWYLRFCASTALAGDK